MNTKRHKTAQPDAIDWKIAELSVTNPSITDAQIGKEVGLSRGAVTRRRQRPAFQSIFDRSVKHAQANLMLLMEKAVSELGSCLNNPDPKIRLAAAVQILKQMPEMPQRTEQVRQKILVDLSWADEEPKEKDALPDVVYVSKWGSTGPG